MIDRININYINHKTKTSFVNFFVFVLRQEKTILGGTYLKVCRDVIITSQLKILCYVVSSSSEPRTRAFQATVPHMSRLTIV